MTFPTLQLRTGDALPALGLGLWKVDRHVAPSLVKQAVAVGYRHFDCACDYGNEAAVGQGLQQVLRDGRCTRDDLWVTSKLWNTYHRPRHVRGAIEKSLADLKLDYLDLYLIHFPISLKFVPLEDRYPPGWFFDPDAIGRIEIAGALPATAPASAAAPYWRQFASRPGMPSGQIGETACRA